MSRGVFGSLVTTALALALAFRLAGLDLRPMHHDEANQAVKFGMLLETGEYRYDWNDHHGPTLYYLTLPSAWIRGQTTLASLDERTLRVVPALFGAGLILLLLLLAGNIGRTSVAASALLVALSPALTYYSRFYIQESLFVFFALGFLVALGRYSQGPRAAWAMGAGAFAGLAYATKETSVIVLLAGGAAVGLARLWTTALAPGFRPSTMLGAGPSTRLGAGSRDAPASRAVTSVANVALGLSVALFVALALYSSFFRYPGGFLESIRAFSIYAERGVDLGPHAQSWDYYLRLLAYSSSGSLVWTEGLVLALALVGMIAALRRSNAGFWPRYIGLYSLMTALAFSIVSYKTPWNVLPFHVGFVLLAGYGAAALADLTKSRAVHGLLVLVFLAAACHLGIEDWRANFRYPADPRNPYAYAQTSPDFLRLVQRVSDLAAIHPDRAQMLVKVIAGPYEQWPLPWYLRRLTRVGYWSRAEEAGRIDDAPVIVASQDNAAALDAALGDRYVSEFYGLRPEVILTVYIERGLWERFLQSRR
jgi:uncharacterized protein (TIGR03663 family)